MSEPQTVVDNYTGPARCPLHPETPATGNCTRCGNFICAVDSKLLFGKLFCTTCSERPELNYLEALRLKYWGKRDSWAWFYGANALSYLAGASLYAFIQQDALPALLCLGTAVICVFYWLGRVWARYALIAAQLAFVIVGFSLRRYELGITGICALLVSMSPLSDLRNKLFFQIPVTEAALKKYWDLHLNNRAARNGLTLGLASVLIPMLIPFAIAFSILGLMHVDPTAHPPIGKKGYAIAGLVMSFTATVLWAAIAVNGYLR